VNLSVDADILKDFDKTRANLMVPRSTLISWLLSEFVKGKINLPQLEPVRKGEAVVIGEAGERGGIV
jgi:metal-responsive CopG/Arc/MetJ family transcriptional regulator